MKVLNRGNSTDISQFDKDTFNLTATNNFKNFAEFVALHYALSHRDDTPYWRDAQNKAMDVENKGSNRITKLMELITNKSIKKFYPVEEGISCVATGLNYFPFTKEDIYSDGYDSVFGDDLENYVLKNTAHLDEQKQRWNNSVKNEKSIYEYLRDNIFN